MAKKKLPAFAHNADVYIGIDPGGMTGTAIWFHGAGLLNMRQFEGHCLALLWSIGIVDGLLLSNPDIRIHFIVEDARKAKKSPHFARDKNATAKLQGVGHVKAYSKDWEIFLTAKGWSHEMVAPNPRITKLDADQFKRQTGIDTKDSQGHARDAALLVYNR